MAWLPCPCCENFWCTLHGAHAYECPCPPIEEWEGDPYTDTTMPDTTLTTAEAARELKISVRAVQRLAARGTLRVARKVGRVLLLDARSVRACDPPRRGRPRDPSAPHSRYRRA